ncbi:HTH-type transcriptional regulator HmrR [mine drainage metagenome]|uniref:HTH-type transcriptional regulator HmrR n=1 Tax=mine drainage metagenome TaxID=410659 RepID=A0A1J5RXE9_9ZZZZ
MPTDADMTIGRLGQAAGVKVETIRYYEKIGLLPPARRTGAGYRLYGPAHAARLRFIRRGRDLGFETDTIRALLDLAEHPGQSCCEADTLAARHLAEVERRIADLLSLRDELRHMICGERHSISECRIIQAMVAGITAPPTHDG